MRRYFKIFLDLLGVKNIAKEMFFLGNSFCVRLFDGFFNAAVRQQNKNYKSIPIIIISFNQYAFLKMQVNFLLKNGYENIIVIDNNSTYPPLLNYFETIKEKVTLHLLDSNMGHLAFWKNRAIFSKYSRGYYVVTDPDILPIEDCPSDFVDKFKKILDHNYKVNKVGFSLKIDDIPATNLNRTLVVKSQEDAWKTKNLQGDYYAMIDTTFALYRPGFDNTSKVFFKGIRTAFPYQARHLSWYIDNKSMSEEMIFLYSNANQSSSWRCNEKGELLDKRYNEYN